MDAGKRVWGLFEVVISFKKSLEMYDTYGLLRRWNKGGEREGSRWIGEEQAWENQGKRGQKELVFYKQVTSQCTCLTEPCT